jgi:hypothetical protein
MSDEEWNKRQPDVEIRELLSSDSSKEVQKQPAPPELTEGAAPYNENITVNQLLNGSFDEEDRRY